MKRIYLDHAATTPVDPRVEEAMRPFWADVFGNASGLYEEGRRAKEALGQARVTIAKLIGAKPDEIIFTSGGTESDNLAVFGSARAAMGTPPSSSKNGFWTSKKTGFFPLGGGVGAGRVPIITTQIYPHPSFHSS